MAASKYVCANTFKVQSACFDSSSRRTSCAGHSTEPTRIPVQAKILVHELMMKIFAFFPSIF